MLNLREMIGSSENLINFATKMVALPSKRGGAKEHQKGTR